MRLGLPSLKGLYPNLVQTTFPNFFSNLGKASCRTDRHDRLKAHFFQKICEKLPNTEEYHSESSFNIKNNAFEFTSVMIG